MAQSHTTRVALPYLHAWRMHRLMSISELSHATGVSRTSIIELEHGRRAANLVTVGKLAAALGVSRRQLVDDAPPSSDSMARASQNVTG
jgi:predicted transcriptional regulator